MNVTKEECLIWLETHSAAVRCAKTTKKHRLKEVEEIVGVG
jgi:hypothetical protein